MKRRQFLKVVGVGLTGVMASLLPTQEVEIGVDVAVPGPDKVSYVAQTPNDLGGYLVPQEYTDALLRRFAEDNKPIMGSAQQVWIGQTDEQKTAREAFFKHMKEQSFPSERGMYYELQSARSVAEHRSEWPGITATWQET